MGNKKSDYNWIFPNYHKTIEKCDTLRDFVELVKKIRGLHPEDDAKLNKNLKKYVVNDWIRRKREKKFTKKPNTAKRIKELAMFALNMEDLNFIEYGNKNFFYLLHVKSRFFKGKQYRCEKCKKIFHTPHFNVFSDRTNRSFIDGYDNAYRIHDYSEPSPDEETETEQDDEMKEDELVFEDEDEMFNRKGKSDDLCRAERNEKIMEYELPDDDNTEPKPGCSYKI